jgi:hypothetical protein
MAELLTRQMCAHRPGRIGEAMCDGCGNPMCASCTVEALAAPPAFSGGG